MRGGLSLIALAALAACEEPGTPVSAECNDGTRIAATKEVAESRCARHRGVKSITPLTDAEEPPAKP